MGLSFCFICLTEAELVPLITKTNDMSTIKIPHNGLPQEIANIPFGQVIVLTNPEQGITSNTTQQILAVISIAGKLNQSHIVYALPVQYSGLWGCYICKVKTEEGVQVLVSDRESVLEMLCEFWGLDFNEVSKSIKLSDRYERYVFLGGESHPLRIPVPVRMPEMERLEDHSILLQCTQVYSKERQLAKIEQSLEEGLSHNIDITFSDLVSLLERIKAKERKTYELSIKIDKGEENEGKNGVWDSRRTCDIILVDNAGKEHPIKMRAQLKALYLTFILFNDGNGIKLSDIKTNDEFYNIFKHICERLRSINNIPDKAGLENEVRGNRSKIKRSIKKETNGDIYAMEQFAIEGDSGDVNKVAGSTDDHRAYIKERFGIKEP